MDLKLAARRGTGGIGVALVVVRYKPFILSVTTDFNWRKSVWVGLNSLKIEAFIWRVFLGRIPVKVELAKIEFGRFFAIPE
ncbi:hypothetical protein V6N11_039831 [Hibiscus sabdariffa]|uniref:Reverse transcriptase zinc-binding domain-containing protein n=1 Tax=Hibiscus sabdariffa TaxID=183260 RepID=A0ABR2RG04_9ROSI